MVWDVRNIGAQKLRRSKSMDRFTNNLKAIATGYNEKGANNEEDV